MSKDFPRPALKSSIPSTISDTNSLSESRVRVSVFDVSILEASIRLNFGASKLSIFRHLPLLIFFLDTRKTAALLDIVSFRRPALPTGGGPSPPRRGRPALPRRRGRSALIPSYLDYIHQKRASLSGLGARKGEAKHSTPPTTASLRPTLGSKSTSGPASAPSGDRRRRRCRTGRTFRGRRPQETPRSGRSPWGRSICRPRSGCTRPRLL